eukprot:7704394-Pyramimonas_sp.AAC.1
MHSGLFEADSRIISYKGQPALMFKDLLPAWPDCARDTAQRGGPRTFNLNRETNRDGGSQGTNIFIRTPNNTHMHSKNP